MRSLNDKVYALVSRIPVGRVTSYGRVARLLGIPNGARAVGWALGHLTSGKDPKTGIEVPWHRVINAGGFISTPQIDFTAAEQRIRLEAEGIMFNAECKVDFKQFLWEPPIWEVRDLWDNDSTDG